MATKTGAEISSVDTTTRKARPWRRAATAGLVAAAGLSLLLSGCTASNEPAPTPTATAPATVDDDALGAALIKLAFQGEQIDVADGGACLVDAVRDAGMSEKALAYIIDTDGDDLSAVASGLLELEPGAANVLLSPQLRTSFDSCVDEVVLSSETAVDPETTYEPAAEITAPVPPAPNLTPAVPVDPVRDINSSQQLAPGVASMFTSFAHNEEQMKLYQAASECVAGEIYDAGFSQAALRFIAGGAPIGSGSIAEFLPTEEDRALWESDAFIQVLVDCTTRTTVEDETDEDQQ